MVVDLNQLVILLLRPLRVLIGRLEQQTLELVEQVLPGIRAHLARYDTRLQIADECGRGSGGRRQLGPMSAVGARAVLMLLSGVGVALRDWPGAGWVRPAAPGRRKEH